MNDIIDSTQRWWAATARSAFLTKPALHICDSPKPEDWARMYRWHMVKQLSAPLLMAGIGFSLLAIVLLLPGTEILGAHIVKPLTVAFGAGGLAAGIACMTMANRKPFSVITMGTELPFTIASEVEQFWVKMNDHERNRLRVDLIRTYETRKDWTPKSLQKALEERVELYRVRVLGEEAGELQR